MANSVIKVLDDQTINKMAAGEVVENTASVVKELVENALDAGSTEISIEIRGGGRQLIRVCDNGCGMGTDDALLCLERHATSKIRAVEDIQGIQTMGFRGEALPSIAAISKFKLLTCPAGASQGTLIFVEGGRLVACSAAARSQGTTVEAGALFFNVPVRRQFQRSPAYDSQAILNLVSLLALAYPHVAFELISDQKTVLKANAPAAQLSLAESLKKRLESVWGAAYVAPLLPIESEHELYRLTGFISPLGVHRPNRTGQHLFINQRLVVSALISNAVREGYSTLLPERRHPLFVLHLYLAGPLLDVNVHPQKKEVRLRREKPLKEALTQAVQGALRREAPRSLPCTAPLLTVDGSSPHQPAAWWPKVPSVMVPAEPWEFMAPPAPSGVAEPHSSGEERPAQSESVPRPSVLLNLASSAAPRVLTTVVGYALLDPATVPARWFIPSNAQKEGGLALLDQRAAYARIYYEHLLNRSAAAETQLLLVPLTLSLTPAELQIIQAHLPLLHRMGFEARQLGKDTLIVDACPAFMPTDQLPTCLQLVIQDLSEMQSSRRLQIKKEERLALTACRAALPSAKRLLLEEAQSLVERLGACELPSCCPLGQPTCVAFSAEEIGRWFI